MTKGGRLALLVTKYDSTLTMVNDNMAKQSINQSIYFVQLQKTMRTSIQILCTVLSTSVNLGRCNPAQKLRKVTLH